MSPDFLVGLVAGYLLCVAASVFAAARRKAILAEKSHGKA